MSRDRKFVIVVAFAACGLSVTAQDRPSPAVYGEGAYSCGRWLQTIGNDQAKARLDRAVMLAWMRGFVTAAGMFGAKPLPKTDSQALEVYIDRSCDGNGLAALSVVGIGLVYELAGKPQQ